MAAPSLLLHRYVAYNYWHEADLSTSFLNIVVSLAGAFLIAPLGGMVMVIILSPFMDRSSLAATGGAVMSIALAGTMVVTLLGAWGALWIVNDRNLRRKTPIRAQRVRPHVERKPYARRGM
jgi:hypothetical protein